MDQLQSEPSSPPVIRRTIAFGRFERFTIRRAPLLLKALVERFVTEGQIGYVAFLRADGAVVDTGSPVKVLTNVF